MYTCRWYQWYSQPGHKGKAWTQCVFENFCVKCRSNYEGLGGMLPQEIMKFRAFQVGPEARLLALLSILNHEYF